MTIFEKFSLIPWSIRDLLIATQLTLRITRVAAFVTANLTLRNAVIFGNVMMNTAFVVPFKIAAHVVTKADIIYGHQTHSEH
ncbi:hypothetical protein [Pseudomonas atacamensis]|jgi:hypothetical protein|uniref:hypothetical protein n=1 Tax=Pseudomonas atacamensis TaxID=2565368 RepID=UPI003811245D